MGAQATVLGASGYTGGELLRLLAGHPVVRVSAAAGGVSAGQDLGAVHGALGPVYGELTLGDVVAVAETPADVCFSCLPSGELGPLLERIAAPIVIDLADSFRGAESWTYGLTEFVRDRLAGASRIANPGCYPTALLLGAIPFARAGVITGPVIVDALSGVSGAGRRAEARFSLGELHANVAAYGDVDHRHVPEMERGLEDLGGLEATVSFTPHLIPMARGLLATVRARITRSLSAEDALEVLAAAYTDEPFVSVVGSWPEAKWAAGTNRVFLTARVDPRVEMVVISISLDNLGKGAAGQAIQNANVVLGQDETCGLEATGLWP